jgi:hypothetical protein
LTQIERNRKAFEKEEHSQCGSHYLSCFTFDILEIIKPKFSWLRDCLQHRVAQVRLLSYHTNGTPHNFATKAPQDPNLF